MLALGNALQSIAELASKYPIASEMLGKYLADQVPIRLLGYYNRIGESATQYAERLLGDKALAKGKKASMVADHLVNHYKDHGFVIDFDEATSLLDAHIINTGTKEYSAADEIFKLLDLVEFVADMN